jgi:hypothetical protein
MITRLGKILSFKREQIKRLNDLNTEAERLNARRHSCSNSTTTTQAFSQEFQMTYALLVLDLERLNKDLNDYLIGVERWCETFSPNFKFLSNATTRDSILNNYNNSKSPMVKLNNDNEFNSTNLKVHYLNRAIDLVNKFNAVKKRPSNNYNNNNQRIEDNMDRIDLNDGGGQKEPSSTEKVGKMANKTKEKLIDSKSTLDLITKLTSLTLQIRDYTNSTAKLKQQQTNGKEDEEEEEEEEEEYENVDDDDDHPAKHMTAFLPFCSKTLSESIDDIKRNLIHKKNVKLFEDKVQIHINHIQSLYHSNKLHAFKYSSNEQRPNNNDDENDKNNEINESSLSNDTDQQEENSIEDFDSNNDFNQYSTSTNINMIKSEII